MNNNHNPHEGCELCNDPNSPVKKDLDTLTYSMYALERLWQKYEEVNMTVVLALTDHGRVYERDDTVTVYLDEFYERLRSIGMDLDCDKSVWGARLDSLEDVSRLFKGATEPNTLLGALMVYFPLKHRTVLEKSRATYGRVIKIARVTPCPALKDTSILREKMCEWWKGMSESLTKVPKTAPDTVVRRVHFESRRFKNMVDEGTTENDAVLAALEEGLMKYGRQL